MTDRFEEPAGWVRFDYSAPDGLLLSGRRYGFENRGSLPVICLAGLTRNSADFHDLAMHLAYAVPARRPVLTLDYRGRGASSRDRNWKNYNLLTEADDVIAGATAAGIGEAVFVGTSRGAMIMMLISAIRPGLIAGAVMNDAGPEIDGRGILRIKSYVENGADFASWSDAVAALKAVGKAHFPAWDDGVWQKQARFIFVERKGRIVRNYDAALSRTFRDLSVDSPMPSFWPQFEGLSRVPVLVIRGENSDLLSAETVARMDARHPRLETITVHGQGHAPDLGTARLPERIGDFIAHTSH